MWPPRYGNGGGSVTTSGEVDGSARGVARRGTAVLRYLSEHPGQLVTGAQIRSLAGAGSDEGRRVLTWLQRAGLLLAAGDAGDDDLLQEPVYRLADAWTQRQRRVRPLILLVEDHSSIAGMTETVLTSEGYNVVLARNPMEAHAILRVVAFDVILTDSFSPTLDLAVRVLGPLLRRSTGTPVVLFTSHHWNPGRVQAEGFTEIITKPFDVERFLARIEQFAPMHQHAGG